MLRALPYLLPRGSEASSPAMSRACSVPDSAPVSARSSSGSSRTLQDMELRGSSMKTSRGSR